MTPTAFDIDEQRPLELGPDAAGTATFLRRDQYATHEARHFGMTVAAAKYNCDTVRVQLNGGTDRDDEGRLRAIAEMLAAPQPPVKIDHTKLPG